MALHKIAEARQDLYDALVAVLPSGRVSAYPRPNDVGIQVWLDETNGGLRGNGIQSEFSVHVAADGSDEAQVAMLDDLISRVWDACELGRLIFPDRWNPAPSLAVGGGSRRHAVVTVQVLIAARTLCPPDSPGESPIPPDKTQE